MLITAITRIPFAMTCIPSVFNLILFNLVLKTSDNLFRYVTAYMELIHSNLRFAECLSVTYMPADLREVNKEEN